MGPPALRSTLFPYTTLFRSVEPARKVGLDRRPGDVQQVRQPGQRLLVPAADEGLAPGREQHADAVTLPSAHPVGEVLRSEEHTSELQSRFDLVCRLLLEKKN